jgi:FG-GAP repeat/FG-GAP-like repeat
MHWNPSKIKKTLKVAFFLGVFLFFGLGIYLLYHYLSTPPTLTTYTESLGEQGKEIQSSFNSTPAMPLTEEGESFVFQDTKGGIQIQYKDQENKPENGIKVTLPKDYSKPIEIKLDESRVITIKDNTTESYSSELLSAEVNQNPNTTQFQKLFNPEEGSKNYLQYQNQRKSILYAYQKDSATGERKMKHWTVYNQGSGEEKESYKIEGATIKKNENGDINVYYQSEQDLKNQAVAKEVPQDLMERAQRTLEKEMGASSDRNPDFIIPKPYYITKDSKREDLEWTVSEETKEISLEFKVSKDQYPIALDPTLQFTAPGVANGGVAINAEAINHSYGSSLTTGDLNSDGKTDLVVGASGYSFGAGRIYIFYNDGAYTTTATTADVTITGETGFFGENTAVGDLNADGKLDLIVGAHQNFSQEGWIYIFYNDGLYPSLAANADVRIEGEANSNFGLGFETGDLNSDGKTDLAVGAYRYSTDIGRVYIFYNDGSIPTTAATADVTITGNATNDYFGFMVGVGDLNSDGRADLVVGANQYSSYTGRTYVFYNDGSIPTTAATADITITGEANSDFGRDFIIADLNSDSKADLVVGGNSASSGDGKTYIFYGGSIVTENATAADEIITGDTGERFGWTFAVGDFNSDGKTDLAVGATDYNSLTGRVYLFYNGSASLGFPTSSTADAIISGAAANDYIGRTLSSGDLNSDGKIDLVVSSQVISGLAKVFIFYSQSVLLNNNFVIGGDAGSDLFGFGLTSGDFNSDGRVDLAVGAHAHGTDLGRVYIFYNDGIYATVAASADVIITGNANNDRFGYELNSGDMNSDGRTDLIVATNAYSSNTGRAYIFYNDGSIPTTAATADVTITGAASEQFGISTTTGDFNADGRTDLAVGAWAITTFTGNTYIFYNDGSIPTTSGTADVTITGEAISNNFGTDVISGDFNADGRIDLAVGAYQYSSGLGRVYIFLNDGSIPTTAATADATISGTATTNKFGGRLASGDLNSDGKTDLAVGSYSAAISADDDVWVFYNDGSYPSDVSAADVVIIGSSEFGSTSLVVDDVNVDGRKDLIAGKQSGGPDAGIYIFYNDGSLPTAEASADVIVLADSSTGSLGANIVTGDFNSDGVTDVLASATAYSTEGGVFFYTGQNNYTWTPQSQPLGSSRVSPNVTGEELQITGEASSKFGATLLAADFNADGKKDLIVGATSYLSNSGRVYIFYNDGDYSSGAASADVIITGSTTNRQFGSSMTFGDMNSDGMSDLIVTGRDNDNGDLFIFYNDGVIPSTSATADVTITRASSGLNNVKLSDLNADGTQDIIVAEPGSSTGSVYVIYNDGSFPASVTSADVTIIGEVSSVFGSTITVGDLNSDGKEDFAVGAGNYSSNVGRAYIFYNDGSIPTTAATADVIITGSGPSLFGGSLTAADLNADGRIDLVARNAMNVYIFYNDGSIPTTVGTADVSISGFTTLSQGHALTSGDLNNDGRIDLVVADNDYSTDQGRAYIFYNDGSLPTTAATADVALTGETTSTAYSSALATGDFNSDGRVDLVVGAEEYSSNRGRTYMYTFNDNVITGGATGDTFGTALASGDFNSDGKVDLVVSAPAYSTATGRVYIFYNGSSSITSSSADVTITGEATSNNFGKSLTTGDLNADGKVDLVVGATGYSTSTGRIYIFNNDGSIPTTAATANTIITGETTNNLFGSALATGDLNADGEIDLVVGAYGYSTSTGRAYIFHGGGFITSSAASADVIITGNAANDSFSANSDSGALAVGDLNADGKVDLAVGAVGYSSSTGRAYIFYNDGSIPTTAGTADVTITGEGSITFFGKGIATGDLNADGRMDLTVGATGATTNLGKVYIFYNDGSIPTTAATADVTIATTVSQSWFGDPIRTGDLNADGKTDLAVASWDFSTLIDKIHIFYNDGSYPATMSLADKILSGNTASDEFSWDFIIADFNLDSINDILVSSPGYSSSTGRVYTLSTETRVTPVETTAGELKGGSAVMKGSFELK